MKLRVLSSFAMAVVIAIAFTINPNARAQDPGSSGSVTSGTAAQSGNSSNGSDSLTGGTVTYNAGGNSNGTANLHGSSDTGMKNGSTSELMTSASRFGGKLGVTGSNPTLTLTGFTGSESWGFQQTKDGNSFIGGGQGSGSSVNGTDSAQSDCGSTSLNGSFNLGSNGHTKLSVSSSPNGLDTTVQGSSGGRSFATGSFSDGAPLSTNVTGSSGLQGQSLVLGPNNSGAMSNFDADSAYAGIHSGQQNVNVLSHSAVNAAGTHAETNTTITSGASADTPASTSQQH